MRLAYVTLSVLLGLHALVEGADFFGLETCGSEKFCEKRPPEGPDYNTLLSVKVLSDDQVEFELWAPRKSNGENINYLAVGFSDDAQMGSEGVTYCYSLESGENGIGIGQTVGKSFNAADDAGDSVESKQISVDDNNFYCKFTQKVNKDSNDLLKPDLSKNYHFLVVRGQASSKTSLSIHKFGPTDGPVITDKIALETPSEQKPSDADPSSNGDPSFGLNKTSGHVPSVSDSSESKPPLNDTTKSTLKKIHGALMLLAWFGLVFSAVYSARHLREHWPNTTVQGLQIWFHIHRLLNVLGVVLIVVSVILIYIEADFAWRGPSIGGENNSSSLVFHTLFGAISVILAIFQPFMALMRCDKNHPRRFIFNFAHRSAGVLAILLAVITLGIAVFKFNSTYSEKNQAISKVIYIAFLVFVVAIVILQEFMRIRESRDSRVTAIELHNRNSSSTDSYYYKNQAFSSRYRHLTSILFISFGSVSFAVSVVLAYFVLSS